MFRIKQIFLAFTRGEKASFFLSAASAILSGTILFVLIFLQLTKAVPTSGGEYREGILGQPSYVNPVLASAKSDKILVRLVFDSIYDIAEKIESSPDGKMWRVRIKEDLIWHDGEKLTSDDIVFTVQKIQDPEGLSPLAQTWQGVAAQRLSELELQLSLVNPYAFFTDVLKNLYILPKHIFENIPLSNWRLSDYNLRPVGSGPYKFLSFEKKQDGFLGTYRLTAWENYRGEKALIENLVFRYFSDIGGLISSFNVGQIDGFSGADPDDIALLTRTHEIITFRIPNYYAVFLNQNKNISFKEKDVRMALSLAINRNDLLEKVLSGHGAVAYGPVPEDAYAASSTIEQVTNIELASSTLNNAGWKMNADGVREKTVNKTKIPLKFNLVAPQVGYLVKTAVYLAGEWRKIGADVNMEILDPLQIISDNIKNRDYETLLFGNTLSRSFDLFSFWHSSERFFPGANVSMYNNKKADAVIESIRQTINEEERRIKFGELNELISNDYPAVFLYSPYYIYVAGKDIRGFGQDFIFDPSERFIDAEKWYLKTARVIK